MPPFRELFCGAGSTLESKRFGSISDVDAG